MWFETWAFHTFISLCLAPSSFAETRDTRLCWAGAWTLEPPHTTFMLLLSWKRELPGWLNQMIVDDDDDDYEPFLVQWPTEKPNCTDWWYWCLVDSYPSIWHVGLSLSLSKCFLTDSNFKRDGHYSSCWCGSIKDASSKSGQILQAAHHLQLVRYSSRFR